MDSAAASHTVLVVDDDPDTRESLAEVLAGAGYRVATAAGGREALRYLREQPRPGVILLDLVMPDLDGWDFIRAQRQDPRVAGVPVIVTTALSGSASPPGGLSAAGYLTKPYHVPLLVEVVASFCDPADG